MKVKYDSLEELLRKINEYATDENPHELGLPLGYGSHTDNLINIILEHFNMELDESPKLAKIMLITGCSREKAIQLLEEL